eukprot:TRINITY_DN3259_c0_g1_i3.p1 TRINITY_DN3259_c0_g1~~TRINITY_DN3259_c0_g1_i3.p1  ORF type:complete len:135 (+),score=16.26 TRINITY_DN3259_c0_g1_i3:44-406(+)
MCIRDSASPSHLNTFGVNNIVSPQPAGLAHIEIPKLPPSKITVPDVNFLDPGFYEKDANEYEIESESEEHFDLLHYPNELSEASGNFLGTGDGVPECFRSGLKVSIALSMAGREFPCFLK